MMRLLFFPQNYQGSHLASHISRLASFPPYHAIAEDEALVAHDAGEEGAQVLGGDTQGVELLYGMRLVVAQGLVYHVEIGVVEGLGEGVVALRTAVVALLAGKGTALTEVAEQQAAAALRGGEGILLHGLDAEGVLLPALFVHGGGDDDA